MESNGDKPLTKEQQLDVDSETEPVPNPEEETKDKKAEGDKTSGKLLGKRTGKSPSTDSGQDLKKKKLGENKDVVEGCEKPAKTPPKPKPEKAHEDPSSSQAKDQKEKKSPKASTSQNCSPFTPEGMEPLRVACKAPARPKPKSRLKKDEPRKDNQSKAKKGKKGKKP